MGNIFSFLLSSTRSTENAACLCLLELSTQSHNAITNDVGSVTLPLIKVFKVSTMSSIGLHPLGQNLIIYQALLIS